MRNSRRALAVQFDVAVTIGSEKRVESSGWRDCLVTRIDSDEFAFSVCQTEVCHDALIVNCGIFNFLNRRPDGFADAGDAGEVCFGDEVRAQIRREPAAAEHEFGALQTLVERATGSLR